jgi:hypothetical protein
MSAIYDVQEWEQKVLRRLRKQEKEEPIKPLSNHQVKQLTQEIFLED